MRINERKVTVFLVIVVDGVPCHSSLAPYPARGRGRVSVSVSVCMCMCALGGWGG